MERNKKRIILIHAHKNLEYLNNLIRELDYPNFIIYVNLDKKSNINPEQIDSRVRLIKKRIPIVWGEYSQVQAILNSLEQIIKEQIDFSHIILISGQDYPIKTNKEIDDFFEDNLNLNFMQYFLVTDTNKYYEYMYRVDRKHFPANRVLSRKFHTAWRLLYKFITGNEYKVKMINRYTMYWGSSWWSLTKESIEYILEVAKNKKITHFFQTTWCSDEVFFQVLLMNSDLKDKISNNYLRYIDWTNCKNNPRNLNEKDDYEKIISSNNLFCRKVESGISDELIKKLKFNRK